MRGESDAVEPQGASEEDRDAGRRVLLALEWLGEALDACGEVPQPLGKQVRALAEGRSTVPADGERIDFVARVRAEMSRSGEDAPAAWAPTLRAWLGDALAAWLGGALAAQPVTALGLALRGPVSQCVAARDALRARHRGAADAFASWYAAGLDDASRAVYAAASSVALDEAVDRWCALGCEAELGRYVATWQRSSSGWAEALLGTRVEVPVGDLGRLRAMQTHLRELQGRRAPKRSIPRALAARLGVSEDEATRLLAVHAQIAARQSPEEVLRRRGSVLRPVARAAQSLERELGRAPGIAEIAARAQVHPCLVELCLEALEGT